MFSLICVAGKAAVKDWGLTMYGTESEPGQAVPSIIEDPHHSHINHNDPTLHQVVDTTEGKTETRDPGSHTASHPSTQSSATPLTSTITIPVPAEKVLPLGCLRSSAVGACLGLCLVVLVVHWWVVGELILARTSPSYDLAQCSPPRVRLAQHPCGLPGPGELAGDSAGVLLSSQGSIVRYS